MKKWANINFYVQAIIIASALLSLPFITIFSLLFAVPFGLWQVISSVVFGVRRKLLESKYRIFLSVYWVVLLITFICLFAVGNQYLYPRHLQDPFISLSVGLSIILGISFFVFSIMVRKNIPVEKNVLSSEVLDQM